MGISMTAITLTANEASTLYTTIVLLNCMAISSGQSTVRTQRLVSESKSILKKSLSEEHLAKLSAASSQPEQK
jgi:hypothetical protein